MLLGIEEHTSFWTREQVGSVHAVGIHGNKETHSWWIVKIILIICLVCVKKFITNFIKEEHILKEKKHILAGPCCEVLC